MEVKNREFYGILIFGTAILTLLETALFDFNPWQVTAVAIFFVGMFTGLLWIQVLVKEQIMIAFIVFVVIGIVLLNPASYELDSVIRPVVYGLVAGAAAGYVGNPGR